MDPRPWLLWLGRLALASAAPWWFSLASRPAGLAGQVCGLLAWGATAYGALCWGLSLATAVCLVCSRGARRAGRMSGLARRGLRILGLSAALGLLSAPLASAHPPAPVGAAEQVPSPAWPTGAPGADGASQREGAAPSGTPGHGSTPRASADTPQAARPGDETPVGPDPSPTGRGRPGAAFIPAPEAPVLGRAWGGGRRDNGVVVVKKGDSLWSIAAAHLGPAADAGDIAAEWPRWYRLNAEVIGENPDLLRVGTRLFVPQ